MDNDRTVRRLTALAKAASTARVLNLVAIHQKLGDDPDLVQAPMFENKLLNRSIILKHRLRANEQDIFEEPRTTVTKVLVPIDENDLKLGARVLFIGQKDYDAIGEAVFGKDLKPGARDRQVLELMDVLPSLDPFLLREHLREHGFEPARSYFGISDADVERMLDYVRDEITPLVKLSAGTGKGSFGHAARLVNKLLSNASDSGFEPLKETFKLSDQEYLDGMFSWRGFLYYKWVLSDLMRPIVQVIREIDQIQPRGVREPEASAYLPGARARLHDCIGRAISNVQTLLQVYDTAYASLTQDGKPLAFLDFLLSAPSMFMRLGEQLGALQHVASFWRYRFPPGPRSSFITPGELMDVFLDFEDSMAFAPEEPARARVA